MANERFAVVGYAVRVPGAGDAAEYWDLLRDGRDAISEIPRDRWNIDEYFDPDPDAMGKMVTRRGGFIGDVSGFDAHFFGISTREAELLDPQHRLLLETTWQAVEHSGTAPSALAGTRTGVYMGMSTQDYLCLLTNRMGVDAIEAYLGTGTSFATATGRISYRLGLVGPAVAVDTACSSSLVAVHQACQALRHGECDVALAGGVNLIISAATMINFSRARMLSPDGRCKTFDAAADGYVRGEGCGVVVIKRLADALADGDVIRAVIRGSAVNQDGASGGLTVPNGIAQQRVIAEALDRSGVTAADVDYLEAHGTGTSLGDPIEVQAAGEVLGAGRAVEHPLLIGSAKTNIGHLEAAAGIAGLIKVILSLEHGEIPRHLNFETPSPHIPWDRYPVRVAAQRTAWERNGKPRVAGVSSFGFSGTNAHIILEEAPEYVAALGAPPSDGECYHVLPLSARTPAAFTELAVRYRDWLDHNPAAELSDVCRTAGVGRSHFEQRAALVVNSTSSAKDLLTAIIEDRPAPGLFRGECGDPPKTAWLFGGQGSQFPGMARELFDTEPVFRDAMMRCADAVADLLDRPLLDVVFDSTDDETLRNTAYAQPALFALEIALAQLWQSWGLQPDVVIGHSVGQYSAACVAGVLSVEDGARLIAERGRLFATLPAGGRMAAVFTAAERVERCTEEFPGLSVAAYNGANTVLSGPGADLERAVAQLSAEDVRCDWLETSHAFHSALLDPVLDEFASYADQFTYSAPQCTLVCNRTGAVATRHVKMNGDYWRRHARQPVEFAKGVVTLAELGCTVLLEVGPQPVLTAAAMRAWPDAEHRPQPIASLRRNRVDQRQLGEALAQAYVCGHRPDFAAVQGGRGRPVELPSYPFQRKRYWYDGKDAHAGSASADGPRTETVRLLEEGRFDELAAQLSPGADPVSVLKGVAALHNRQRSSQTIADDRYEIAWEVVEPSRPAGVTAQDGVDWLVITDDGAGVSELTEAMRARGYPHRTLALPRSDEDEARLEAGLRGLSAMGPAPRILFLAGLDEDGASPLECVQRLQDRVFPGAQRLFRATLASGTKARVWMVTRGAQLITGAESVAPTQRSLWGLGHTTSVELPDLWGGIADLGTNETDEWSALLDHVVAGSMADDEIAVRGSAVHCPRLQRRPAPQTSDPLELRDDATYLVTGGLGVIGLEIAELLATQGARHVVLTSRSEPSDAALRRIDEITAQYGCGIHVITADVSDAGEIDRLLERIRTELPRLAGIVHAAGVYADGSLLEHDPADVERIFAGKVRGGLMLSQAVSGMPLDFFLNTSSISALWSTRDLMFYAAANAYLDGLSHWQRQHGIPGVTVAFGLWTDGMGADSREAFNAFGIRTLSPDEALTGMVELLAAGAPYGIVARLDWPRFLPLQHINRKKGFLRRIERELPEQPAASASFGSTPLIDELRSAPAQQRTTLMLEYVRNAVAEVTKIDPGDIRDDTGFFDLGMDSLMAVELHRRLERGCGRPLPVTLAMDHPRLAEAATFLLTDVLALGAEKAPRTAQAGAVAETRLDEPIAIVGMACRVPGASNPDEFWSLLSGGADMIREIPDDRYDINDFYDPDPDAPGRIYTRYGGFLDSIDGFDPEFFGISPREAVWIDPQQRLVLETAWEGLERAGLSPAALRGSMSGVYVGVGANEYSHVLSTNSVESIAAQFATGNAISVIAGRVAFALGLEGPAVAVDTACSSSLVAIHQACQALHTGDCDLALAGGVNVLLSPIITIATSRARMLAPDGRCKTFDAAADGYVRSEGCGMLVLKRLGDAERDGDRIHAVIRGSAVNQDGASGGLTVPNGGAQQRVISAALARAGVAGGDVDYLEAHGTGTSLGDPIEVQAAAAVYGAERDRARPLLIGSVKTNLGHLESAAGVTGLIKVVLALGHQELPRNLHFQNPSPHIPWDRLPVRVVDETTPWRTNGRPRRAGVSSFGFSGTNAHVVVEEAPVPSPVCADDAQVDTPDPVSVLPLSARSSEALSDLAAEFRDWLAARPQTRLEDVCFTAGTGRSHFEHRAALVVDDIGRTRELLNELAGNRNAAGLLRGQCGDPPSTAWLFTGQGSQHVGMARELFDAEPVFAETVTTCAHAVDALLPRPLLDVLLGSPDHDEATLRDTSYAQPALYAVEMGLARLWQSRGVTPDVVLGHSVGQYAAACVAGIFGLEDGARLVTHRGRLFGALPEGGRMVAVFGEAETVEDFADDFPMVSVAAYNGTNTVLSGPTADVERLVELCAAEGIRCTRLDTSHAFHSELLEPALDEFESHAAGIDYAAAELPLVCNRTGKVLTGSDRVDARYWRRHARQPVQFAESVRTLAGLGTAVLMELGPQPVLNAAALQCWPESTAPPKAIASLRKGVDARTQLAEAVAAAYVAGHRPAFAALHRRPGRRLELPTYPFQRRTYWPKTGGIRHDGSTVSGLLGTAQDLASGDVVYTSRFSVKTQPWLADHVIYGTVVVPGATYGAMVLAAVGAPVTVTDVYFFEPILLADKDSREVQLAMRQRDDGLGWTFQVHSRPWGDREAEWALNAEGAAASGVGASDAPAPQEPVEEMLEGLVRLRPQQLFEVFADNELALGPAWQTSLKSLWAGEHEAVGDITVGSALADQIGSEPVHPVLFDLCAGIALAAVHSKAGDLDAGVDLFLPLQYGSVTLREPMPSRFYCRARWVPGPLDGETAVFHLDFMDRDGRSIGGLAGFTVKRAPREALLRGLGSDATRVLYGIGWRESTPPPSDQTPPPGTWLVAGFDDLAAALPGAIRFDKALGVDEFARTMEQMSPSGIIWRANGPASPRDSSTESSSDFQGRLEAELSDLLAVVHPVLEGAALPGGLWVVTERAVATEAHEAVDPAQATLWGLGRTIISEQPVVRCRLVDVDDSPDGATALLRLLGAPGDESEVAVRQGRFLVPRVLPWARTGYLMVPRRTDYMLAPTERGAINNLRLVATEIPSPPPGHVQVRVQAAGINFRDVLNVLGLYPGDPGPVGGDFAGVVSAVSPDVTDFVVGQRVFGLMPGSMASRVNVPVQFIHPIPDGVSAAVAASTVTAVMTSLLSYRFAELKPGDRVLVHAATGGVGISAVQLAQQRGATVFATASTYKRATLRAMGVKYVYDSRSTDFADQILADTDGEGVDVVLNSLTNEGFIEATVRATARHGRFIEIAKRDIWSPERMAQVRPDLSYEVFAYDLMMLEHPDLFKPLAEELSAGLTSGEILPPPLEIYPMADAKSAFRRMQQARHVGKIVMTVPEPLQPRADRSYLITGGLGALGLHTAGYLAQMGANDIVLTSRRAPDDDTARAIAELSDRYHCRIHTVATDLGDEAQVSTLLRWIRSELPPLGGVAHLAGVIDDALLPQQNLERFRKTLAPKAFGAWHLHRLTADDPLEFFVLYSSGTSVLGSPGQANYAAANAMLDGLAFYRSSRGLPATSVNWGPWAQGGMASSEAARANLGARGLIPLDPGTSLNALGEIVAQGIRQATVLKANWRRAAKLLGGIRPPILDIVLPTAAATSPGHSALLAKLHDIPEAQRGGFITEHLQRELQQVLGLAQQPVAASRFLELGMDSLMAVELRNRLLSQFGSAFTISATAVFDYPSIGQLADHLAAQTPDDEPAPTDPADSVA
ncbi:SDR family NAD(P)-dependent oxidoreductase [Mycobacterium sp.]|uniref:SDR family NAD(P)-dependent oxidoreductase n=1 Tax=Mycobacterium sp. TaxID=1785 RepID=UPI002BEB8428|nr:SDR family NAD(P)-dependent oxidoreductase [Mycobacterium sp.]HKP40452.1 SDR family NAD(P)-dependent oxidoreductase [Mycobacterium sp.]